MIPRYSRPELAEIWSDRARMERWRQVEVAACEELPWLLPELGEGEGPTEQELEAIRQASFTVEAVQARERETGHDVAAFVDVLAASAGPAGRWIHYGLTSSDVLDTALALQLKAAGTEVIAALDRLLGLLCRRAREEAATLCIGRTHGIHAEPTTFGLKLASFAFELARNRRRLKAAFGQAVVGAISGPVGTYSATLPEYERRVLGRLGLPAEPVSTQVVPRDRHAELLYAIALCGAGLERLALEIRHLQRTEVSEAFEPFGSAQKGSSAMPHKRNPVASEQICGLARVLRANASAAIENVALWHERDISHSSVERVVLPDSTILLHYLLERSRWLIEGLELDRERMAANLELTHGAIYSGPLLLALVREGMQRDDAYRLVQRSALEAYRSGKPLAELIAASGALPTQRLAELFDPRCYTRHVGEIVDRLKEVEAELAGAAGEL